MNPSPMETVLGEGRGGGKTSLHSVQFDKQMDNISLWLEEWDHQTVSSQFKKLFYKFHFKILTLKKSKIPFSCLLHFGNQNLSEFSPKNIKNGCQSDCLPISSSCRFLRTFTWKQVNLAWPNEI